MWARIGGNGVDTVAYDSSSCAVALQSPDALVSGVTLTGTQNLTGGTGSAFLLAMISPTTGPLAVINAAEVLFL